MRWKFHILTTFGTNLVHWQKKDQFAFVPDIIPTNYIHGMSDRHWGLQVDLDDALMPLPPFSILGVLIAHPFTQQIPKHDGPIILISVRKSKLRNSRCIGKILITLGPACKNLYAYIISICIFSVIT